MPRDANHYREAGGLQEAINRTVEAFNQQAKRRVEGTTTERANHLQGGGDMSREDLLSVLHSPPSSAVRVNLNESASTFKFMVGVDSLTDDVVMG